METKEAIVLTIKSSIFDRTRKLTIDPSYIEFDDRSSVGLEPTKFEKNHIEAFRYGVRPIQGYQFVIGRIYCIDIRGAGGKVIKIRMKSLYGVRKLELAKKYVVIVNALLDYFFDDKSRAYLKKFAEGESFQILGVTFSSEGIRLKEESTLIQWPDVGTQSYATYYSIYSKATPTHYKAFEYLDQWNTAILYTVSREILKEKKLWNE